MSDEQKKNLMTGITGAADKVVGDVLLGGIGQGAFYLHQVPGVKQATRYIGENVADGWNEAAGRQQKAVALRLVQELVSRRDIPTSEEIREACVNAGVSEDMLPAVAEQARMAVAGKAAAMESIREAKGQETAPSTPEVPLPSVTGTLQPAVG